MKILTFALAVVLSSAINQDAYAATKDIQALFRPDPTSSQDEFVNQTPSEGFCAQMPEKCKAQGVFSLIANIEFNSLAPILANHTDPRRGGMAKVPSQWRPITVTHSSGATEVVEVRISGIGHESLLHERVDVITNGGTWDELWEGGGWWYAPLPCTGVGTYSAGFHGYNSFWLVPEGAGVCAKKALFNIPAFTYRYFVYGYQLRTPNPLAMESGDYTGSLTYTVGPGQDFDMGDVMVPDDSVLTLNFLLEVDHILRVVLPAGGNRIELLPQGGWQAWLHQGRPPSRLFRDQTFNLYASSRFKMQLECGLVIGNTCGLRNGEGDEVPLQVGVTLPYGLNDQYGQAVTKRPLRLDGSGTELFQPTHYVNNRPASLHFEVEKNYVTQMLRNPGSTYTGVATVIWDSEV